MIPSAPQDELLRQIQSFLQAHDRLGLDRATLEAVLIVEHLQPAVDAARIKGYTADLLVTGLLALFTRGAE